MQDNERFISTQAVYDAICELHEKEQPSTRLAVAQLTGLKLTTVDDRIKALKDSERITPVLRGWYVPVVIHPPARAISKSVLTDGFVKIEIGDEVITLTPREARRLAEMMAGEVCIAVAIASASRNDLAMIEFQSKIDRMEREQAENPTKEIAQSLASSVKSLERHAAATEAMRRQQEQGMHQQDLPHVN